MLNTIIKKNFEKHLNLILIFVSSCYSFNRGLNSNNEPIRDKFSTKAGSIYGLQLELFIGNPSDPNSLAFVNGLRIFVHNKTEKPTYLFGVNANVGQYTSITISRTFSSRMEQPYSDCIADIDSYAQKSLYVKTILATNYSYKQTQCFDVCLQKYVVKDCGCYSTDSPYWDTKNTKPCELNSEVNCYTSTMAYFYTGDLSEMCGDGCPLECQTFTYTTSASSVIYPNDMFAARLKNNQNIQSRFNWRTDVSPDELRASILSINVYYSSLSYVSFTESAKTQLVDLISNIGGTMGLFLGVSFLSFLELLDLMFYLFLALKTRSNGSQFIVVERNPQIRTLADQIGPNRGFERRKSNEHEANLFSVMTYDGQYLTPINI